MKNQNLNLCTITSFLFDKSVWQGVWANFLFALIGAFLIFIIIKDAIHLHVEDRVEAGEEMPI